MKKHLALTALCVFGLLSAAPAFSQSFTATIRGIVKDGSDAGVAGAKVVAREAARNIDHPTTSDSEGRYVVTALPPGRYTLSVELAGFKKFQQKEFELQVSQQATIDVTLSVGDVSTSIEISSSAPLINTTSSSLGQVVENRYIQALPLAGRSPLALVSLAPGITPVNQNPNGQTNTNFVASGTRNSTADVLLDGMSVTTIEQNSGVTDLKYQPSVDVVQEFKVATNSLAAEYGNTGAAIINMVTKSGTNQFHGNAYEFHRNSALNANEWFANRNGRAIPDFTRNVFGGTLGGPVHIPKVYDGRNKTFFFVDYEGTRQTSATSATATMPTIAERTGDFSNTRNSNGTLSVIYNPFDTYKLANGDTRRNPFPGNIVPLSMQNPIARKVMSYYLDPTTAGNQYTQTNNFFNQSTNKSSANQMDFKIDHTLNDKNRLSGRYSRNRSQSIAANLWGSAANRFSDGDGYTHTQNGVLDFTRVQSASTIYTFRLGVTRSDYSRIPQSFGFNPTSLGLPAIYNTSGVNLFPSFAPENYQAIGTNGYALMGRGEDVSSITGSVVKNLSGHTIKAGGEGRFMRLNYLQPGYPQGNFNFGRGTTGENPLTASNTQGNAIASMLLGWGTGGDYHIDPWSASASQYFGFYVQDDWKVTRKLTLNIGLRYDFDVPRTERYNRLSWFDFGAPSPIAGKVPGYENLKGQFRFTDSETRSPLNSDMNNFQPRAGFAYALDSKTAIRGGFGVQYATSRGTVKGHTGSGFTTNSSPQFSRDSGLTPYATLSNPYPNGLTLPPGNTLGTSTFLGLGIGTEQRDNENPQILAWNLSVQRELGWNSVFEINYAATKGNHLYYGGLENQNLLDPRYWSLGRTALNESVANPFASVITNSQSRLSQTTIPRSVLLRPFPQYDGGVSGNSPSRANSIYHSMQLRFEKRFSKGFSALAHYTWAKSIDDTALTNGNVSWLGGGTNVQNRYDLRQERSLSANDLTHRATITFSYQLPFGRGRQFGSGMNQVANLLVGGWELSGLTTLAVGFPIIPTLANGQLWDASQRPNLVGNPGTSGRIQDRLNAYLNPAAFTRPASDTYGSSARTLNTRTPGVRSFDTALMKNFNLGEKRYFQFRAESFNFFNHPIFSGPNSNFGDSNFGVITGTSVGSRQMQLALKFYF
ncbi:carboxypeptidase-like regulatory domain-containing protein [Bryobacter aggregatus]|uniref:carboxypeptidase-like regulatory domain-containing protein n=1 Tax=Bryobacter aggregatus TaxID=360054 RepID=UPI0004E1CC32|nr:carboxypeptidase-like regulatory domain-containing protein [Bryobacter aggregatus]